MKAKSRYLNINFNKTVQRRRWDDQKDFEDSGITPSAQYKYLENKAYISSFFLDGWIFDARRPNILNIPSMCFIMAHELFHGLDSNLMNYDHKGLC